MNQDQLFYARMTGAYGSVHIGGTNIVTGEFSRIEVITATKFDTLTNTLDTTADFDVAASGTLTFTDAPHVDSTIEVNSVTYTFKTAADPAEDQITIGTGGNAAAMATATAANVAAKLAEDTDVVATASAGVVTVTAATAGDGGNSITLTAGTGTNHCTADPVDALAGGITQERAIAPTYPANHTLHGNFTTIKLTSGDVIAYHANRQ